MDPQTQEGTPNPENIPTENTSLKKNSLYLEVLLESCVVLAIIILLIGIFSYFKIISFSNFLPHTQTAKVISPTPTPRPNNALPIDPNQDGVESTIISYVVISPIQDLTTDTKGTHIVFSKIHTIDFDIGTKTRLAFSTDPTKFIDMSNLKKTDTVSLNITYNYKAKTLLLNSITILNRTK